MAFIREYALADELGDPFFKGLRRRLKKIGRGAFRVGRGAFGLARRGLSLAGRFPIPLPGPLGVAQRVAGWAGDPEWDDEEEAFSRMYGDEWGDPGRVPKRKQAAAGPRAKAKRKREVRKARRRGPGRLERGLGKFTRGLGKIGGALLPGALQAGAQILQQSGAEPEDDLGALAAALPAPGGGTMLPVPAGPRGMVPSRAQVARYTKRGTLTFRKRPSMQVTNTKALRRSLRRVEGFNAVVKRVYRAMPALRPGGSMRTGRRGGHKAGCRCVACKAK